MFLQAIRSILLVYVSATLKPADLQAPLSLIKDFEPHLSDQYFLEILKADI